jgi:hypothetical protein
MKKAALALCLFFAALALASALAEPAPSGTLRLELLHQQPQPVLTIRSPEARGINHGFEGGSVTKLGNTYHLITAEMSGDPFWVKMQIGHWASQDRLHWKRASTLFTSSGDFAGKDPRAALWGPMPIYGEREQRWELFYVAYRSAPNTATEWRNNYEGRIWRAVSTVKGREGIGGPYKDVGVILQPDAESQPWEGLQGTDSFYPYLVGHRWYAFYGSANTEKMPIEHWRVGLASAPRLAGPWKRLREGNPLPIEKVFMENPIVTRLADGTYVAVYDSPAPNAIGYTSSRDGVHWEAGQELVVQPQGKGHWAEDVRTPLGLIPEPDGTFTLFYTGYRNVRSKFPDTTDPGDSAVGLVTVRLRQ